MSRARTTCLGDGAADYAAGRLHPFRQRFWDRHLVVCLSCQAAVTRERELQARLVADVPAAPGDLRIQLLAMASVLRGGEGAPASPLHDAVASPAVVAQLRLVATDAPPCHRSALRAAVIAVAAVSASAAAAITLTVAGAPATAPAKGAAPAPAHLGGPTQRAFVTFPVAVGVRTPAPATTTRPGGAQSTP